MMTPVRPGRDRSTFAAHDAAEPSSALARGRPVSVRPGMPAALIVVVMVAMISAVGLLYILQTNQVASLGYELSRLSQVREEKLAEQERLSAELAQAYSLAEIERISRDELGMEEAWSKQFLSVPMPAEPELPLPEQESAEHESWWGTVWDRLTGTGSATHEAEEPRP